MELGEDLVLLADNPRLEVLDLDALPAARFLELLAGVFADDAIHFDDAFVVNQVEQQLVGD